MARPPAKKSRTKLIDHYLAPRSGSERIAVLEDMIAQDQRLPLSLVHDLLQLDLGPREHQMLIRAASAEDPEALDNFLTGDILERDQDLVALALREWAERSPTAQRDRVLALAQKGDLSQRVRYSILDIAWHAEGSEIVRAMQSLPDLQSYSAAFLSLLFERSLQWNMVSPAIQRAVHIVLDLTHDPHAPDIKAIPFALMIAERLDTNALAPILRNPKTLEVWRQLALVIQSTPLDAERWPPLFRRHTLSAERILDQLRSDQRRSEAVWQTYAGCRSEALIEAVARANADTAAFALRILGSLIPHNHALDLIRHHDQGWTEEAWDVIPAYLRGATSAARRKAQTQPHGASDTAFETARHTFVDLAYRGRAPAEGPSTHIAANNVDDDAWRLLARAWMRPSADLLDPLAGAARKLPGIYQICFLDTLAKFYGHDGAVLKILDYVRSSDEAELRAVFRGLAGIATPRAQQELLAALSRPNTTPALRWDIYQKLTTQDLAQVQHELRAAISDLEGRRRAGADAGAGEIIDALKSLIKVDTALASDKPASPAAESDVDPTSQVDRELTAEVPRFGTFSSEVRRALRTARFFQHQTQKDRSGTAIDLSPIVDMLYKALELLFRENFEDSCNQLIQSGVLQRKLDLLGYARPIPAQMDAFENYLASQPTIRDIPFFSKFKLRKLLRNICVFRPGKRFTLDGLKAFALFFLVFGRQECRYGLEDLFATGFANDNDLAEFCKLVHLLQDFRNRAVHEGLPPNATGDIRTMWTMTTNIIDVVFKLKEGGSSQDKGSTNIRSAPTIIRRAS